MKFQLNYDDNNPLKAIYQFQNLREWLNNKNIKYNFTWDNTSSYTADYVEILDEQDAMLFKLSMNYKFVKDSN